MDVVGQKFHKWLNITTKNVENELEYGEDSEFLRALKMCQLQLEMILENEKQEVSFN